MPQIIYLVGQISPKFEETYNWRKNVEDEFFNTPNIELINPCANPFNEKLLQKKEYAITREKISSGINVLPSKDYTFCRRSTMAIANMNQYDPTKPLLGSFFELAWYFTMPEKTVIAFADDLNSYACKHPFVQQSVTEWVHNEYEACSLIDRYFSGIS